MNFIISLIISLLCVMSVSVSGQYFTAKSVKSKWYECISPKETPPSFVFPIVWSFLYFCIFVAFALALKEEDALLILLFVVNLLLNPLWCYFYFEKKKLLYALFCILCLVFTTVAIQYVSYRDSKVVAALLIPYILWISFATFLNVKSIQNEKKCTLMHS